MATRLTTSGASGAQAAAAYSLLAQRCATLASAYRRDTSGAPASNPGGNPSQMHQKGPKWGVSLGLKGQTCDPNTLRAQHLENRWRCYL